MLNKALFLDRDGVINVDTAYVHKVEDFVFCEGIFELVREAKSREYQVVVVTNQAGIGRGYYSEADFTALMEWVAQQFVQQGGGLDGVYFCPDHPEHGKGPYRRHSDARKPGPGMLLQAQRDLRLDLPHSIMVGDNLTDMQAGMAAGVGTNLLVRGDGQSSPRNDFVVIQTLSQVLPYLR
ncbi:D-glycero-beta-D-manno-heptose 1,7-bisphosphate 7-phosphatase [Corticibacter populi]|uniref:D,D-heptose 1,7-bisphosphate phosphatase n=1 Tax=Corticibacter populi TaxID=1550736 RepID=A0A3M6QM58_9BURK|nr:D-glycero-beta-D-manno-heptose 1,7-bisphosphate 7-phosphatase [Corticibacter populi]RMX04173.1 D-glycero-beta-D-manno-heptose 1,7-bisphosphate 7-phosphatase [Corticibacter populi]RZS33195.1 D-alpha,beta-D-heptose 1,7-bisphosphate phosphatase [Corticibacter populi]